MWNRFKKSKRGSEAKHDQVVDERHDDVDMSRDCEVRPLEGVSESIVTPSKTKVKRKLSLFGAKPRGKTTSSDNAVNGAVTVDTNQEPEAVLRSDVASSEEKKRGNKDATSRDCPGASNRQSGMSGMSNFSGDSALSDLVDGSNVPISSRNQRDASRCGRLSVSDMVDDDDEVFHRQPTVLSTFAATASVDVIAKPSPPKMKRRAKTSTGSNHSTETETRRSKLSKPSSSVTPASLTRPSVEPVQVPTVPTVPPSTDDSKNASLFRSPASVNSLSATTSGSAKRVPPPVPVRRSSTLNGNSDVISPSRDVTRQSGIHPPSSVTLAIGGPRTLCSVSSMRSSPGDSGSDDTEGKESGYMTLDDLEAQLMRSSWSSDKEVEQTITSDGNTTRAPPPPGGLADSYCSSEVSRMMTPDSLMMTSQTSTTLSCGPTTTHNDEDDDVISWPEPPSPLDHLTTVSNTEDSHVTSSHVTTTTTVTSSGVDGRLPPVMTLTFTVKLDGDLIKNKSIIQQTPTSVMGEVVLQGGNQSTSGPSRPAVIIPDVVVCAGATTMASVDRGSDSQVSHQRATATSLVAVVDAKCRYDDDEQRSRAIKESRSCQTEPSAICNTQCVTCLRPTNDNAAMTMQQSVDEIAEDDCDDVFDDVDPSSTSCKCRCRVDDGSYLRPLVTTKVYNSKSSPIATSSRDHINSGVTSVRHDSEELTHMSWNEVLEEAQTMGIELHPPPTTNSRHSKHHVTHHVTSEPNRSPSIKSFQSIMDVETPSCRSPRRHLHPVADDIDELSQMIDQSSVSNVAMLNESTNKKKSSTSIRDLFSKLFSSKKKSSATVKRSKSLEQPNRIRSQPVVPSNSSKYVRQDSSNSESNRSRLSRACSRYSASSCPSTSGHVVGRTAPPSRTISVASSTMRCGSGQTTTDYFLGSTCSSGGVGLHGGSLPAIHRHRVTSSSTSRGDQTLMTTSFDAGDLIDGCCASPSLGSFSNTCSRSTQWRSAVSGTPSSPTKQISKSCHTASGLFSSLSVKCSTWKGNKTDFVTSLSELQNYGWYWGALGFEDAEDKLANRRDGSFLVRDSSDERYILSLSFRSLGGTHHTRIEHYKGSFSFCSQSPPVISNLTPASTIVEFIECAMAASRAGQCLYYLRPRAPGLPPAPVRLVYPVSRFRCMHSLQHLCKFAVLRHVRLDMVDRLPVPPRLKEYLKHGRPTVE